MTAPGGRAFELSLAPRAGTPIASFCDALPAIGDDVVHETIDRRTWPALGEFDLVRFTDTLRGRGWTGLVSVEVLSTAPYGTEARQ